MRTLELEELDVLDEPGEWQEPGERQELGELEERQEPGEQQGPGVLEEPEELEDDWDWDERPPGEDDRPLPPHKDWSHGFGGKDIVCFHRLAGSPAVPQAGVQRMPATGKGVAPMATETLVPADVPMFSIRVLLTATETLVPADALMDSIGGPPTAVRP